MLNVIRPDGRKYSLERDVLSVYPHATAAAAHNELAEPGWSDDLRAYLLDAGASAADLVPAGGALATSVAWGARVRHDPAAASLAEVLERSGFRTLKPAAAYAAFYALGRQFVLAHHYYARHAFRRRETAAGFDDAAEAAARAAWALARRKPREARDPRDPGPAGRPKAPRGRYEACRDVVYLFLDVATEAAVELARGWPAAVAGWAGRAGVPDAALVPAVRGLAGLAEAATRDAGNDAGHAWSAAGLDAAPAPVRFAVHAGLGFELLWAYHEHAAAVTPHEPTDYEGCHARPLLGPDQCDTSRDTP